MTKAVFFDRDGVLNVDKNYLYKKEDFVWQPQARETIALLKQMGYFVAVVTNQSGVARGMYTEHDVKVLHDFMQAQLADLYTGIDVFYYCPHLPDANLAKYALDCDCRKPKPGMIIKAIKEYNLSREGSFLIGDKERDIKAAVAAGVAGYLYTEGSLLEFTKQILAKK